jgi:hypothetical protein
MALRTVSTMTPKPILTSFVLLASLVFGPKIVGTLAPTEAARVAAMEPARQLVEAPTTPPARVQEAEELLEWGRQRYADEGLQLPEITLVVHPSLQQCGGRVGRYDESTNEFVLCRIDRETVLHELAHAWIDHNLDGADRARFVELRGVDEWNDRSQEWADRGAEQAAEILVWALSDRDRTVRWVEGGVESRRLLSIENSSPVLLAAGFELMVGHQPSRRMIDTPDAAAFSPETQRAVADTVASAFSPEVQLLEPLAVVPDTATVELVDMPGELADMAVWALNLFDQADLELPPVRFRAPWRGHGAVSRANRHASSCRRCERDRGVRDRGVVRDPGDDSARDRPCLDRTSADTRAQGCLQGAAGLGALAGLRRRCVAQQRY